MRGHADTMTNSGGRVRATAAMPWARKLRPAQERAAATRAALLAARRSV